MESFGPGMCKTPELTRTIAYRARISVATIGSGKPQGPSKRIPRTHSVLTDVDRSRTQHREDQPSHIRVIDQDVCRESCIPTYGSPPCAHFCPAQVYELTESDHGPHIQVNFSNCVHCKTCVIVDPCKTNAGKNIQNIDWRAPAEGGPRYQIL